MSATSTTTLPAQIVWSVHELDKAVTLLAQRAGLAATGVIPPPHTARSHNLHEWVPILAAQLGIDSRAAYLSYGETLRFLWHTGPVLLPLTSERFVAVLRGGRWRCTLLANDGTTRTFGPSTIRSAVFHTEEGDNHAHISAQVAAVTDPSRREAVYEALRLEYLGHLRCSVAAWQFGRILRGGWFEQLRSSGIMALVALHLGVRFLWYTLFFLALGLLGGSLSTGRVEWTILWAGLLVWLLRIPLAGLSAWVERRLGLRVGMYIKSQLLRGALSLDPDDIAQRGSGAFLFLWSQSEVFLESWLNRGKWFLSSLIFISMAMGVLLLIGDVLSAAFLGAWLVMALVAVWRFVRRYQHLDATYSTMNSKLLERLQGHGTRLVQESDWHSTVDRDLAAYLQQARTLDSRLAFVWVWIPYGAFLLIILALAPDFVLAPQSLAASSNIVNLRFAVLLFTLDQLYYLALALPDVARMSAAWQQTRPLREKAGQNAVAAPVPPSDVEQPLPDQPFLEVQNVSYMYEPNGKAILTQASAFIRGDDNIVLTGASGSGKSTFAQILAGLRDHQGGLVLLHGYDQPTIGTVAWRKHLVLVPQFYANQLFDGSLAFNLLMGRHWPPTAADLHEAEALCRALGLDALLDHMPQGIHQPLGHDGWQLSHGERNRIYIARALLQNPYLVILDESLTALDPDLLRSVSHTVRKHTHALLVISHQE